MSACGSPRRGASAGATATDVFTEYRAAHFVLDSDAPVDEVRDWLVDLETSYVVLREFLLDDRNDPTPPTHVVLFSHSADLHRFIPSDAVAAFVTGVANDPERQPVMLMETSSAHEEARRILLHEMTHTFVGQAFGNVPLWLNEGLAQYFETMRIETNRIVLGQPIAGASAAATQLPPLRSLLSADAAVFYAGMRNAHSVESLYQQSAYYVAAWNLVHMLMHGDGYRSRFLDYLALLRRGAPQAAAWARCFDRATFQRLETDYFEYLRSESLALGSLSREASREDAVLPSARVLTRAETEMLWARLARAGRP